MPTFVAGYNGYFAHGTAASETDFSAITESVDFERVVAMLETTSFGSSSKTRIPGLKDATLKATMRWDQTLVGTLNTNFGATSKQALVGPQGSTAGQVKYTVPSVISKIGEKYSVGGLDLVDVEFSPTGAVTVGTF